MSPQYLEELADIADPDSLWKLSPLEQMDLPTYKRVQLDAGVALRRKGRSSKPTRERTRAGCLGFYGPSGRSNGCVLRASWSPSLAWRDSE